MTVGDLAVDRVDGLLGRDPDYRAGGILHKALLCAIRRGSEAGLVVAWCVCLRENRNHNGAARMGE